jgi:HSP20 family protein
MNSLISRGSFLDDFFRDAASGFPGFYVRPLHGDPLPTPAQIKVDVKEGETAYTVHAEVPGVAKEDIHVSVDGNMVTLRAEVKQHDETKGDNDKPLRSERYFGAVSRSFQLPTDVDHYEARAKYDNGVLTLTLPKKAGARLHQVAIE